MHGRLLRILPEAQRLTPPKRISGTDRNCKDWLDVLNVMKGARETPRLGAKEPRVFESEAWAEPRVSVRPADDPQSPGVG
ncbi:hypothetical protein RSP03_34220 [Cereibacter sphaeroides]|nr:hypothetical protein RSP03_34220 [Cereibacter sphaeroides]